MEQSTLEQRIARLREAMEAEGLGGAILSRPQHIFYFTGSTPVAAPVFLIVMAKRLLAVAPYPLPGCETVTYPDYDIYHGWNVVESAGRALDAALAACGPLSPAAGLELDHLPAALLPVALRHIHQPRDLKETLWRIRRIKDAQELAQIEANIAANDRVFEAVEAALRPGVEALDVWAVVQDGLCRHAGGPVILEADLGAGARGSNPDAKPGPFTIQAGESVFVDVYSATHNYYADTTRVFTIGAADARQRQIFSILQDALAAGETCLRPGTPANVVDAAVRGVIARAGHGANFPHHSGHAYGLFQQEKPYLVPAESAPLEAGMILTLEPGIYIPGWGGMRLEGNYLIEAASARRLDQFPSELIACG